MRMRTRLSPALTLDSADTNDHHFPTPHFASCFSLLWHLLNLEFSLLIVNYLSFPKRFLLHKKFIGEIVEWNPNKFHYIRWICLFTHGLIHNAEFVKIRKVVSLTNVFNFVSRLKCARLTKDQAMICHDDDHGFNW